MSLFTAIIILQSVKLQQRAAEFYGSCFCLHSSTHSFKLPIVALKSIRVARVMENYDCRPQYLQNLLHSRHIGIFKDALNRCSCGQKYPTDKYPKRIQLRNESRSCLGMSVTTKLMHARITCICLIKCFFAEKSMQFK